MNLWELWVAMPTGYNDALIIIIGMVLTLVFVGWMEKRRSRKELKRIQKEVNKSVLDTKSRIINMN